MSTLLSRFPTLSRRSFLPLLALAATLLPFAAWAEIPLRVVTYNIYLGKALVKEREATSEKKRNKYSIARVFEKEVSLAGVDVLGVQELCAHQAGWQLEYFERILQRGTQEPVYSTFGLADPVGPGYGNCQRGEAIFSRYPILDSGVIQLPNVKEPRTAIWADLLVGGTLVRVYNLHLENMPKGSWTHGRFLQTQAVVDHYLEWRGHYPAAPVILLGDLNTVGHFIDPFIREKSLKFLARYLEPSHPEFARTHRYVFHQIDWIFASRAQLVRSKIVHVNHSDHYPVMADYLIP
jgi:endonuclease/exonuclease/phosphatase family metal-dependent hydrolase